MNDQIALHNPGAEYEQLMGDLLLNWINSDILWDAWISELRSGPYIQGFTALLRKGCYCPLGVLCSVAGIPATFRFGPEGAAQFAGRTGCLPDALAEFMGMDPYGAFNNAVPAFRRALPRDEYPAGSIISLNDTARWTFVAQAEYLASHRDNLKPYEVTS